MPYGGRGRASISSPLPDWITVEQSAGHLLLCRDFPFAVAIAVAAAVTATQSQPLTGGRLAANVNERFEAWTLASLLSRISPECLNPGSAACHPLLWWAQDQASDTIFLHLDRTLGWLGAPS